MLGKGLGTRHGSAFDRGGADSYYRRPYEPHYYLGHTYQSERVPEILMTAEEIAAYKDGYEQNENDGNFKDWG